MDFGYLVGSAIFVSLLERNPRARIALAVATLFAGSLFDDPGPLV